MSLSRSCFLLTALIPAVAVAQPEPAPAPTEPPPAPPPTEPVKPEEPPPPVVPPPVAPEPHHDMADHHVDDHKADDHKADKDEHKKDTPWYEKLKIRGYFQGRYNRIYATNDDFKNDLGDKAIANNKGFSIRRARLVVSGDVAPFLAMYMQAEFAGAEAKTRDWYGDIFLDKHKELRLRVGESKVPYGWENMQSSSNRAPLDRSDPINSATPGERDLGAILFWETKEARKLLKHLVDDGLKGSGDYGMLALGVYNGQGINTDDKNQNRHVVARATYPMDLGSQIIEFGANGYIGKFTTDRDPGIGGKLNIRDMRVGGHFILYPQPIGFQAEYNVGKGPELDVDSNSLVAKNLHGGYAMVIAHFGDFFPFVRGAYFDGAIKADKNAPHHETSELIVGSEWHFHKKIELTVEVDHARRRIADDEVRGTVVRGQVQLNY